MKFTVVPLNFRAWLRAVKQTAACESLCYHTTTVSWLTANWKTGYWEKGNKLICSTGDHGGGGSYIVSCFYSFLEMWQRSTARENNICKTTVTLLRHGSVTEGVRFWIGGSILIWLVFPFVFMSSDSSNLHKPHSALPNTTTTEGGLEGGKRNSMELVLDPKNQTPTF